MPARNRSLTISVIIDPPAAMPCALEKYCPQRGIVFEIAQIMCQQLRFDCKFVPANTTIYGLFENGTWKGVVGDVAAGRVTTSLPRFTPTQQRAEVNDFSSSYFFEQYLLVTRKPDATIYDEKLNLVHAFGMGVWICIAVVMIVAGLIMSNTILFKRPMSFLESYLLKILRREVLFFGKHTCIWIISAAALILSRSYTGYLFTNRIMAEPQKPFDDLESFTTCVQTQKCTLAIKTGSLSYVRQLTDTNGSQIFQKLRMALNENPLQTFALTDLFKKIKNDKSSFYTALIWDTDFYYGATGHNVCDYYAISAALLPGSNSFPLPKNWTPKRELDKFAAIFQEQGFITQIMSRYNIATTTRCPRVILVESDSIEFLLDIFVFLLAGESLAALCLCLETTSRRGVHLEVRRRWLLLLEISRAMRRSRVDTIA